ncbi:MAG TPA: PAS domain-containing sensor histidine kinase [Deltaproteobacteria bacterium]|nr:PAS domain-containing sensor histidine kinase [Deltaproteobacteria bacterium]
MKDIHSLLQRQLKRFFGGTENIPEELQEFMNAVNIAYREFDIDREMLERSLELSSKEMLQTNAEMRAIFHALPDILFVIDEQGMILDHKMHDDSDAYFKQDDNLIGKRIQDIPEPDVSKVFQDALLRVRSTEKVISFEYSLNIETSINHYEARMTPVIDNRFIVIVRNITQRKIAEENLRAERDFTGTLVQSSPVFYVALNPDGKVIMMNHAMLDALDYTLSEVAGIDFISTFLPSADRAEISKILMQNVWNSDSLPTESRLLAKNGQEILVEWYGRPILKKDGKPDFFFGIGIDITGKRHLEEQLNQARKLEAVGTLAGGVAHDFNNLLMGIQGRTSLMLIDTEQAHPHHEHLQGIEEYVKSAAMLTRQLLGFAKGGKYDAKPTNLNDLLVKTSEMFGRTKKELMIKRTLDENLLAVDVDQGQIEQVMLNLFVNAGQAMPYGGELHILTGNVILDQDYVKPYGLYPGDYVKISVTDTGVGMDEETRARIFEPFFTTKIMGRGTGLGLASAYGIIKNHEGIINVYSSKGQGTTFTIYLPASARAVIREVKPQEHILQGNETILIVDDEQIVLDVGIKMLTSLGYRVFSAGGGNDAVELYKNERDAIDMIILDMIMPELSGGETFIKLKEINPHVKVLLSSGYSLNGQAEEILSNGCMGFIQKPFTIKDLSIRLKEILNKDQKP